MVKELSLTDGPTVEQMFNSLKRGHSLKALEVVEFLGKEEHQSGKGNLIHIKIDGLYLTNKNGNEWSIYGQQMEIISSRQWSPEWYTRSVGFVFVRWNVHQRYGRMLLGASSFYVEPVTQEEAAAL